LCEPSGLCNLRRATANDHIRSAFAGLTDQNPILERVGYAIELLGLGIPTWIENDL
jgi:hypothetical protein